jgi:hypothetical protein
MRQPPNFVTLLKNKFWRPRQCPRPKWPLPMPRSLLYRFQYWKKSWGNHKKVQRKKMFLLKSMTKLEALTVPSEITFLFWIIFFPSWIRIPIRIVRTWLQIRNFCRPSKIFFPLGILSFTCFHNSPLNYKKVINFRRLSRASEEYLRSVAGGQAAG